MRLKIPHVLTDDYVSDIANNSIQLRLYKLNELIELENKLDEYRERHDEATKKMVNKLLELAASATDQDESQRFKQVADSIEMDNQRLLHRTYYTAAGDVNRAIVERLQTDFQKPPKVQVRHIHSFYAYILKKYSFIVLKDKDLSSTFGFTDKSHRREAKKRRDQKMKAPKDFFGLIKDIVGEGNDEREAISIIRHLNSRLPDKAKAKAGINTELDELLSNGKIRT
jgi:hypothetical protein